MPLIPFAGRLYSIPKSELERYQVTREQAAELGFELPDAGGDELGLDDLDQVAGGLGTISPNYPQKLQLADGITDANRLRLPGQFSPKPDVQWYSGD